MAKFLFWEKEEIYRTLIIQAPSKDEAMAKFNDGEYGEGEECNTTSDWIDGGFKWEVEGDDG